MRKLKVIFGKNADDLVDLVNSFYETEKIKGINSISYQKEGQSYIAFIDYDQFNSPLIDPHVESKVVLYEPISVDNFIIETLNKFQDDYNDSELARFLGLSRKTIWEKRKKYDFFRSR